MYMYVITNIVNMCVKMFVVSLILEYSVFHQSCNVNYIMLYMYMYVEPHSF